MLQKKLSLHPLPEINDGIIELINGIKREVKIPFPFCILIDL